MSGQAGESARRPIAGATILAWVWVLALAWLLWVAAPIARGDESAAGGREAPELLAEPSTDVSPELETWHVSSFVSGSMGLRVIDYWSKGPWMRANTLIGGHPITTIVRGDRYFAFDPLRGEGLSIRRSSRAREQDASRGRPFGNDLQELIDAGGEEIENVRLAGVDATMWRVTDDAFRRTVWVRRRKPVLPLRVETFDRASAQTISLDYVSWRGEIEIPDAFFELPSGLAVLELEYDAYLEASAQGPVGSLPILYPDLLHGGRIR